MINIHVRINFVRIQKQTHEHPKKRQAIYGHIHIIKNMMMNIHINRNTIIHMYIKIYTNLIRHVSIYIHMNINHT